MHVAGRTLAKADGTPITLHGVDRSGAEFMCVQGHGFFDGPADQASVTTMKSWHVNSVRVPLNEDCWLGHSNVDPAYAGAAYIGAVRSYVDLLERNGLVAVLDLHWTDGVYTGPSAGCPDANATCQKPMPDAAGAIPFWTSPAPTSQPGRVLALVQLQRLQHHFLLGRPDRPAHRASAGHRR
ncbi:cellulase family glycosylhydrolase [Kitasatospora aureofaciens]|uniref:cellulase family glycosylhydrolase n=1 Tax=Kitasatospora aureofaciens TaxID=1894 RepID=UPI000698D0F0|nr:cellulase family glycosylhydrolase [Kitasatospora aureofaciens]